MAIRINNTTVIDDSRNANNIPSLTFSDGTVQRTAAPVFGDTVTAGGALVHTLNNPNAYSTSDSDYFGASVAISGNYAIVSAYGEDEAGGADSGKAYIFNVTTGQLVHTLNNPNAYSTSAGDSFGSPVSISGNYAIVGAKNEDDAGGTASGKAYIFNVTTGQLVHTLNNPNTYSTSLNDLFGSSVAISGNFAIVGAFGEDDAGGGGSGKAYIYNVTTGQLLWTLNNPNAYSTSQTDFFSDVSVAISNNYAVVGAYNEADVNGTASGKVYIFSLNTGQLVQTINNPNAFSTSANDNFGLSVDISDNYVIAGAYGEGDGSGSYSGKAYIFNVTTGQLVHTLNNPNTYSTSENDVFGDDVAISGNYAVVNGRQEDDTGGTQSGKAYVYNVTTGQLLYTLNNPNAYSTSASDFFADEIAISGNYVIAGAYAEDESGGNTFSGKAYIFNVETIRNSNYVEEIQFTNGTTLNLLADKAFQSVHPGGALIHVLNNPNAYSTSLNDYFGYVVSISGNYAVVSASSEADAGGSFSGRVYVYNVTSGNLLYQLVNPNAFGSSTDDQFGTALSLSENYIAIGAWQEDAGGGNDSGRVYIYNITTGQLIWSINNPNAYSTSQDDRFASAVAISGNYAIVGAHAEDDAGGTFSGKAYIYNVTTGQLLYTLNNPNTYSVSGGDGFGISIAISGNYAIVGARTEDDSAGAQSGKAYIYDVTTGQLLWTLNNPNAYSTSAGDEFGWSVAISGNFAIVGAQSEDDTEGNSSGKAYIYNVTTGALVWTLNNPNAFSTSSSDQFGYSVGISGNYAIVSAVSEDDAGGTESGKAYIYNVTTGQLLYTLNNPNAYSTSLNDGFGISVAISGNYAIVGAFNEDDAGGNDSGKAYIFSTQNLTYLDKILTVAESIF